MLATTIRGNNGPRYRHNPDESAPYKTIGVDKLTPIIGAEIDGIDLSRPLADEQLDEVHRALAENCVIFFATRRSPRSSTSPLAVGSASCTCTRPRHTSRACPHS